MAHEGSLTSTQKARDFKFTLAKCPANQSTNIEPTQFISAMNTMDWPYWIAQLEEGESGYLHYQGYFQCKSPTRVSTVLKKFKTAGLVNENGQAFVHLGLRGKSSVEHEIRYCSKEKTRVDGPWHFGDSGVRLANHQGQRTDLMTLREAVKEGLSYNDLMLSDEYGPLINSSTMPVIKSYIEEREIAQQTDMTRDDMTVYYVWGTPGTGKTWSAYYHPQIWADDTWTDHDVYVPDLGSNPWDGYLNQSVLLLDEFSSKDYQFKEFNRLLDYYPMRLGARYRDRQARWNRVVMTSNEPIDSIYPHIEGPRRMAIMRRIKYVIHFTAESIEKSRLVVDGDDYRLESVSKIKNTARGGTYYDID